MRAGSTSRRRVMQVHSSYPAQLSDDAIAALLPVLPPLDSSATSAHTAAAARLQQLFTIAADDMKRAAVTMRNIWQQWQLLPVCSAMDTYQQTLVDCTKSITQAEARRDNAIVADVFEKFKSGTTGLSHDELTRALRELSAPVLATDPASSAESMFRLADVLAKDAVDLNECDPIELPPRPQLVTAVFDGCCASVYHSQSSHITLTLAVAVSNAL